MNQGSFCMLRLRTLYHSFAFSYWKSEPMVKMMLLLVNEAA